jgi:hypothetical protein
MAALSDSVVVKRRGADSSISHAWRGRFLPSFVGMAPFGSLLARYLAHLVGAPHTVMFTGAVVFLGGVWFWLKLREVRNAMRPIYIELGILPAEEVVNTMTR